MNNDSDLTTAPSMLLEHCPAPRLDSLIPQTETTILNLLARQPDRVDARFALANLYLGNERFVEAIELYQTVLSRAPGTTAARCNLGICYYAISQHELAISELSQTILQSPDLAIASLYLARAHEAEGALETARTWFEKSVELDPNSSSSLAGLAAIYEMLGQAERSQETYRNLLSQSPDHLVAERRLGEVYFLRGRAAFEQGALERAFSEWGEGYRRYPRAFNSEQGIANELRKLVKEFQAAKRLAAARKRFLAATIDAATPVNVVEAESYPLFCKLYFELGLFPELYEAQETLAERLGWWEQERDRGGAYPYAHVRLGAIYSYQARFQEALDSFTFAEDHMPAGKRKPLRLTEIIRFIRDLMRGRAVAGRASSEATADEWTAAGFGDSFGQEAWKKTGLAPSVAGQWRDAGFSASQSTKWLDESIELDAAREWVEHGFTDPLQVRRWIRGGFAPTDALLWLAEFQDGVAQALQCRQAGFPDPKTARAWLAVFSVPYAAAPWYQLGFTPEQAEQWIKEGVADPFAAKTLRDQDEAVLRAAAEDSSDPVD